MEKKILHIDVNNAFLSWTAVHRLSQGESLDLRTVPSVVGGDEKTRHGIVVAKSNVAKKFGIKTAEPIYSARRKCPSIIVVPSEFEVYRYYSNKLYKLFLEYTPKVERFSIDECFLDMTDFISPNQDIIKLGIEIKERVKKEFGFTVNVGVSDDKILAKIASDFEKPDKLHTLFKSEIKEKLWPLDVSEMFLVGKKSVPKLNKMGIKTIGDLATCEKEKLFKEFGKFGYTIWSYSNGESREEVNYKRERPKGIGNEETLPYDYVKIEDLEEKVVEISQKVAWRLRKENMLATGVSVNLKTKDFVSSSHQKKLKGRTDSTQEIIDLAKELLKEMYKGESIRLVGVRVEGLVEKEEMQLSMFDEEDDKKDKRIDEAIDKLKEKYGYNIVSRATNLKQKKKE